MKKITAAIITITLIAGLVLAGCGSNANEEKTTTAAKEEVTTTAPSSSDYTGAGSYTINGVKIVPGEDFADALSSLGDPDEFSEAASCNYDGMDKTYTYDGFEITTYPDGDIDRIASLLITDESLESSKGIKIGASLDNITAAYGDGYVKSGSMYKYYADDDIYEYFFLLAGEVTYFGVAIDS